MKKVKTTCVKQWFLICFVTLFPGVAACENEVKEDLCPMYVHPLDVTGKKIRYDRFDKKAGEHFISFENGDVLIARYSQNCDLAFDITFLAVNSVEDKKAKIAELAWLVNLFKNDVESDQSIRKQLEKIKVLDTSEFSIVLDGIRLDEMHSLTVQSIKIGKDVYQPLFRQLWSYSWIPPSGE